MFNKGDYFIYSSRGICYVDDICEKKVDGVKRMYYVFHPITDESAKIMTPVDNKKIFMRRIIEKSEAEDIITSFQTPEIIPWTDNKKLRDKEFVIILKQGNAAEIAKILKVLMVKRHEAKLADKKLSDSDNKLLQSIQQTIFNELAVVLDDTPQHISKLVADHLRHLLKCSPGM